MNLLIQAMVTQITYADELSPSSDITRLSEEMAKWLPYIVKGISQKIW